MTKKLVVTVGNGMMGDDAAGTLLARKLKGTPLEGWEVLDGGSAPENFLHRIRELSPDYVLIVDAADMDLEPGSIRLIEVEKLEDPFLMTTHTLPLFYFAQSLSEYVPRVEMIGIQPEMVAFGYPVSTSVLRAVDEVYESLSRGSWEWDCL
jgi:hydrogenase 3 maturation protease